MALAGLGVYRDGPNFTDLGDGVVPSGELVAIMLLLPYILVLFAVAHLAHWRQRIAKEQAAREAQAQRAAMDARASRHTAGAAGFGQRGSVRAAPVEQPQPSEAPAVSSIRQRGFTAWAWRDKAWSYLRAMIALFSTLTLFIAIGHGMSPSQSIGRTFASYYGGFVLALAFLGPGVPILLMLVETFERWGIRRGWMDVGVATALGSLMLIAPIVSAVVKGRMPELQVVGLGLVYTLAAAAGGFEFWRAEGCPGASRRTAMLLTRFRSGLFRGLRMSG